MLFKLTVATLNLLLCF